jgi:hypothetical protein
MLGQAMQPHRTGRPGSRSPKVAWATKCENRKEQCTVAWLLNHDAANSCSCRRFVLHQFQAKTLPPLLHAGDLDVYDGLGWPLLDFHAFLVRVEDHHGLFHHAGSQQRITML